MFPFPLSFCFHHIPHPPLLSRQSCFPLITFACHPPQAGFFFFSFLFLDMKFNNPVPTSDDNQTPTLRSPLLCVLFNTEHGPQPSRQTFSTPDHEPQWRQVHPPLLFNFEISRVPHPFPGAVLPFSNSAFLTSFYPLAAVPPPPLFFNMVLGYYGSFHSSRAPRSRILLFLFLPL